MKRRKLHDDDTASRRKHAPERLADALGAYLKEAGLDARVVQAAVVPEWAALVGREIAEVTEPLFVTADGTLFVGVTTNPWMTELQLMERQILAALNADSPHPRARRLRFQLLRDRPPRGDLNS